MEGERPFPFVDDSDDTDGSLGMRVLRIVLIALAAPLCRSLVLPGVGRAAPTCSPRARPVRAGLFDGLFGESEAQKAAKDEQWRIMKEMQIFILS